MLAGLLFAIEEAADDPAWLVASLPLAGATVIEHQARQLAAAGATQIVVVVGERSNPELHGALNRIARRGVAVDRAGSAVEAVALLHPLARILMVADGLVAADALVEAVSRSETEALVVLPLDEAPRGFERIGGANAWAGLARIDPPRLAELAALPPDYAPQSTLLRLTAAAGAVHVALPAGALEEGHVIAADGAMLDEAERRMVAAALRPDPDWFDRWFLSPPTRWLVPRLVARGVDALIVLGLAALVGAGGLFAIAIGAFGWGVSAAMLAILAATVSAAMARLRDEAALATVVRTGMMAGAAVAILLLGWRCDAIGGGGAAFPVAAALVAGAALVERSDAAPARWWGGAASCLFAVAVPTVAGFPVVGLVLGALYVLAMLTLAIETLRRA